MVNVNTNPFTSVFQATMYISLLMMGFGMFQYMESAKQYSDQLYLHGATQDSLLFEFKIDSLAIKDQDKKFSRIEAEIKRLDSIPLGNDTTLKERVISAMKADLDSMSILAQVATENLVKGFHRQSFYKALNNKTDHLEGNYKLSDKLSNVLFYGGAILFAISLFKLSRNESRISSMTLIDQYKKGKVWLWCQSCGRNFSAKRPHGTESDKSKNFGYCLECYKDGQFTEPNLTRDEVKVTFDTIINSAKGDKNANEVKKHFTKRFNSLERWNKGEYTKITIDSYLNT